MLQYSQIPEFLKTTRSTFGRDIPWKVSDFFRTKNDLKKCIWSQVKLIRHWNKTNLIPTCLNFKLELTEHIRNRNSIFVGLVYTSAYWLRLCIRFYDSGKENVSKTYCLTIWSIFRAYQEYLFQALFFLWISESGFIE